MRGLGPTSPLQPGAGATMAPALGGRQAAAPGRWAGRSARLTQLGVGLGSGPYGQGQAWPIFVSLGASGVFLKQLF